VNDQTAPVITGVPSATTVSCASDVPTASITSVTATDNCAGTVTVTVDDVISAQTCANRYTVTRTWTATDVCGNSSTASQTITVNDQTAPVISGAIAASTVPGSSASAAPAAVTTVAALETMGLIISDNCTADASLIVTNSDSTIAGCPIVVKRTYSVTDACGNSSTYVQTITIQATALVATAIQTGPAITCNGLTTQVSVSATGGTAPYTGTGLNTVGAGTYNYTVTDANGCTSATSITLTEPPVLPTPVISGTFTRCAVGAGTATFTIAPVSDGVNPTSYSWSVPAGFSITSGQGPTTLNVSYTAGAIDANISGQVAVTAFTVCTSTSSSQTVSYSTTLPVTPNSISGPTRLCQGNTATYSIAAVYRASSYVWTVPTGITITSGQGTNILNISVTTAYVGGNLSVAAVNACGTGPARIRVTALNLLNAPGSISGPTSGVCGETQTYSIAAISGAVTYNWTVPAGATINSGQGTTSINVTFGTFTSGAITVSATNNCGTGAVRSMTVFGSPARPGTIAGSALVCAGATEGYSVNTVDGAITYSWSVTSGGTITTGNGGKVITIVWSPTAAASQTVIVSATNACGTSSNRTLTVTVSTCPRLSGVAEGVTMTAYPNPATDLAYVEFNGKENQQYNLKLTDLSGRIMLQQGGVSAEGLNKVQLDLANVPSGVYLVVLETSDARETHRLMVE
jgi:hypothetical protein